MSKSERSIETNAVHGAGFIKSLTGAVSTPIYQSATFKHRELGVSTGYDYSRLSNPTRDELEKTVALLEGGKDALAFASGMTAVSNLFAIFKPGDHIVISDDIYGGTYRYIEEVLKEYGIAADYVDTTDLQAVKAAIKANTKTIFIETPSNPLMKVTDISAVSEISKEWGLLTIVDNTFLTPYLQRPLDLGADIVVHSGTKFLGGHNDTLAGFIVAKDDKIIERLKRIQKTLGGVLAPFDSWLILRGIKTLAIRMDKQESNTEAIAKWLKTHKKVEAVYYPGFEDYPGHEIMKKQSSGFGAMLSFTVDSEDTVKRILKEVKLVSFAESLGGVETLITYPFVQTHGDVPEEVKESGGITKRLLRLSVGIEKAEDLISDLQQALG
ncbi:trans-sulfuration enzyme family protein [Clostridium thermarum]|uniref:trans-sulfuration enzyme family protein n=1 Tax=Clostridium thermarum TaxID=1716543 RepID=UPI0013CFC149|nr:PLP-dependent aspartate aminotransferase family protein [Clostridium thermarum]